jgi:pilus assembly protein CpaB
MSQGGEVVTAAVAAAGWVVRHRTLAMGVVAIVLGIVAAVGMRSHIGLQLAIERAQLGNHQEMVELLVAKRELSPGELVGSDTLAIREIPLEFAPGGALGPDDFDTFVGSRFAVSMRRGEPLLPGMLHEPQRHGLSARLKPGVRALTVSVDEVNSLSGMLQPGDRIDLLLSVRPPSLDGAPTPEVTRTLMQGVTVLATGRHVRPGVDDGQGRTFTAITVEVDPVQAQKLVVAQRNGRLTAMLRHAEDRSTFLDQRLDVNALLGYAPKNPVAAAPMPQANQPIEVIVGGSGRLSGHSQLAGGPMAGGSLPIPRRFNGATGVGDIKAEMEPDDSAEAPDGRDQAVWPLARERFRARDHFPSPSFPSTATPR